MDIINAIFLGVVQGITEFLPISSSAHLILTPLLAGWQDQGVAFDLAVHVGTLLAVLLYFRRDVTALIQDGAMSFQRRQFVGQGKLALYIVVATIPAVIAGLLLMELIDNQLRSVAIIFVTTLLFGLMLGWADLRPNKQRQLNDLKLVDVVLIGLAQAVALIPGTSRSGATITMALFLGLSREASSRFSFWMAIPITALASAAKLIDVAQSNLSVDWLAFLIGGISSFIMALTAIHFFLKWLNQYGMWPYVIYRILLAGLIYFFFLT